MDFLSTSQRFTAEQLRQMRCNHKHVSFNEKEQRFVCDACGGRFMTGPERVEALAELLKDELNYERTR
jgi:PHP family Zn ribbon phosphoesterase